MTAKVLRNPFATANAPVPKPAPASVSPITITGAVDIYASSIFGGTYDGTAGYLDVSNTTANAISGTGAPSLTAPASVSYAVLNGNAVLAGSGAGLNIQGTSGGFQSVVNGPAQVLATATVIDSTVQGHAVVGGTASVSDAVIQGTYTITSGTIIDGTYG